MKLFRCYQCGFEVQANEAPAKVCCPACGAGDPYHMGAVPGIEISTTETPVTFADLPFWQRWGAAYILKSLKEGTLNMNQLLGALKNSLGSKTMWIAVLSWLGVHEPHIANAVNAIGADKVVEWVVGLFGVLRLVTSKPIIPDHK